MTSAPIHPVAPWRAALTRAAGAASAGPAVLEEAARQLEERGL